MLVVANETSGDNAMWCTVQDIRDQMPQLGMWLNEVEDATQYVTDRIIDETSTAQSYLLQRYSWNIRAGWIDSGIPAVLRKHVIALVCEVIAGRRAQTEGKGDEKTSTRWEREGNRARKYLADARDGTVTIPHSYVPGEVMHTGDGMSGRISRYNGSF